jgi:hypothetical protein
MLRDRRFRILQSAACLLCAILVWRYVAPLEGTEFSGGRITGPLLHMANFSVLLFFLGLFLGLLKNRFTAAVTLAATLFALPVFLYFVCPGPFRHIFKGNYSVPAPSSFVWDTPSVVGMVALTLAITVSLQDLIAFRARVKSRADI